MDLPYKWNMKEKIYTVKLHEKRLLTYSPSSLPKRDEIDRMIEKAKALTASQAKRTKRDTQKLKYVLMETGTKHLFPMNQNAMTKICDLQDIMYHNSEIEMKDSDIYDVYHNLWRIEESFKIVKYNLDARSLSSEGRNDKKDIF